MTNKLFYGNGFPTEEGEAYLKSFQEELDKLLANQTSEQEISMMGCALHKLVGDAVSARQLAHRQMVEKKNALWKMTDEEFELHLVSKYGEKFTVFTTMTEEESDRYRPIAKARISVAMAKIAEENKYRTPPYQKTPWFPRGRRY